MKPMFSSIDQVSIIVNDALETAKKWNDDFGVGPWYFLNFDETNMTKQKFHGKPVKYAMKIALCSFYEVELELIEPKDPNSSYAEFLREHGQGIHHIAMKTPDNVFKETCEELDSRGFECVQSGADPNGEDLVYYDLREELGFIVELNDRDENFVPVPPDECYPKKE